MKKSIQICFLAIAMLALFTGCSQKKDPVTLDTDALVNELLEDAEFEDELNAIDEDTVKKLYGIEDFTSAQVYISSGATAEEIAVFAFDTEDAATAGLEKAQERIADQKADFETYIPKEVPKLDSAIVQQYGTYVILCVSNGDTAGEIITQYTNPAE